MLMLMLRLTAAADAHRRNVDDYVFRVSPEMTAHYSNGCAQGGVLGGVCQL